MALDQNPRESFFSLLYRFFFFDWLFMDLTRSRSLLEHHAAWKHNREMRKYLPLYLRRWSVLSALAFSFGALCDRVLEAQVAATCCFTGFGAAVAVLAVILVSWIFMAGLETCPAYDRHRR